MLQFSEFPSDLSFACLTEDVGGSLPLHPEEILLSKQFRNQARKSSFFLGRKAARSLLRKFELPDSLPVLRGEGDEPIWPNEIHGSIAHRGEFAVAVATRSPLFRSVGIDIELLSKPSSTRVAKRICTKNEQEMLPFQEQARALQILKIFSAKEAFYKAAYPLIRRFLGFRDVELKWLADTFTGRILQPESPLEMSLEVLGSVSIQGEILLSVAYVETGK